MNLSVFYGMSFDGFPCHFSSDICIYIYVCVSMVNLKQCVGCGLHLVNKKNLQNLFYVVPILPQNPTAIESD